MFLVTTADERTWKKDEKIIFLGEWCKLYSRKHIWSKLDYETVPYHWNDKQKLFHDYKYIDSVFERYLENISDRLNKIHKSNYSIRYWRILIGVWLLNFIEILFDRYLSITSAIEPYNIKSTWIIDADNMRWTPADMNQFQQFYISDSWNHYIFGEIIKHLNFLSYKKINIKNAYNTKDIREFSFYNFKKNFKTFIAPVINKTFNASNTVFFSSSIFGKKYQANLEHSLGQFPQLVEPDLSVPHFAIDNARFLLKPNIAKNEFEELLEVMIPMQIPIAYWEGYEYLRHKARQIYPNNVKIIFTANSYHFNEGFKVWAAEKTENEAKLLIGQHGGNMGSCLMNSSESHQINISDRFYSWGWTNANQKKVKPLPAIQLMKFKNSLKPRIDGKILHILGSYPRYSYIMYSAPISSQFEDYINEQISFLKNLSDPIYKLINVRLERSRSYKWFVESRLEKNGFGNLICKKNIDLIKTLNNCNLCIVTTNTTTLLETLVSNFPTLVFWDPNQWELRPTARPYYDELYKSGILHFTPESAAEKLNEIYQDPIGWWEQDFIQSARNEFVEQFAFTSANWLNEWKNELKTLNK